MEFIKLARLADFDKENIKSYRIGGRLVGIIKRQDGTFYATEIGCKHQGADLTKGTIVGHIATCARHNWQYNLETGKCLTNPSPPLRRHALKVEGDHLLVSFFPLEDQEEAG